MIELIYPVGENAPMIPPANGASTMSAIKGKGKGTRYSLPEYFPVVEEDGRVVGRATREYCHSGSMLLHPVVHLHLIDRQERVYLQKRSMKKDLMPGKWDTAVGGHVMYGESIVEALHRESSEELHLTDYNPIFLGSYVYDTGRDREYVFIFAAVGHFAVRPDRDEVEQGKWLSLQKIEEMAQQGLLTPNFQSEFAEIKNQLLALL